MVHQLYKENGRLPTLVYWKQALFMLPSGRRINPFLSCNHHYNINLAETRYRFVHSYLCFQWISKRISASLGENTFSKKHLSPQLTPDAISRSTLKSSPPKATWHSVLIPFFRRSIMASSSSSHLLGRLHKPVARSSSHIPNHGFHPWGRDSSLWVFCSRLGTMPSLYSCSRHEDSGYQWAGGFFLLFLHP